MTWPATPLAVPTARPLAGHTDTLNGHGSGGTHLVSAVEGSSSPQAKNDAAPRSCPPAGDQHSQDQAILVSQASTVLAASSPSGHHGVVTQKGSAAGDDAGQPAAIPQSVPNEPALLADPLLALSADILADLEAVRIANENRYRQLTRSQQDADGETRGFGLDEAHPDVARLAALVTMLAQAEHQATLNLQRLMRAHPLGPWLKSQKGIGEKQGARLLAAIGDPYLRPEITREDGTVEPSRPRTVSELWAYTGYHVIHAPASSQPATVAQVGAAAGGSDVPASHQTRGDQAEPAGGDGSHPGQHQVADPHASHAGVAARRRKGQHANWSPTAKMRAHLIAESCIKQLDGPYRATYDTTRTKYAAATHQAPCERCGPSGHPAEPGSPLSAGHQHARALRAVAKQILKDLWREARDIHLSAT